MTTRTVRPRGRTRHRRRGHSRRRSGFWKGFRHATHTDQLRTRIGAAAGRAAIRAINKRRARMGKPPIPQRGGSWYDPTPNRRPRPSRPPRPGSPGVRAPRPTPGRPIRNPRPPRVAGAPPQGGQGPTTGQKIKKAVQAVTPTGPAVQTKGQAKAAGAPPAFSGPHVGTGTGKASQQTGSGIVSGVAGTVAGVLSGNGPQATSVTGSGVQGPGNRGAGASTGVPAYGTGGESGDGDHMISPGSAGGSATGGTPVPPGGLYGPHGGEGPGPGRRTRPPGERPPEWGTPPEGGDGQTGTSTGSPGEYTPRWNGGGHVSTETEELMETPETDAEYLAALRGLADRIKAMAESVQEVQASLLENVGMDQAALGAYEGIAEGLTQAAEGCNQAVIDFLNTYQGVIETAQSGVKIPGGEGRFFTGDVG